MSTPVVTDKWAGNFDCSVCRRKRLVGAEFSKKALEKYRKTGGALKCKTCTAAQEEKERLAAAAKKATASTTSDTISANANDPPVTCAKCKKSLPPTDFNRNQIAKKEKARCRKCVEEAIQLEESSIKSSKEAKLQEILKKIQEMEKKGDIAGRVRYESELSALEAEHVTGLKPVKMGNAGVRGSWRSRSKGGGRG